MKVFDIETDGLLDEVTKIHCINYYDSEKKKHFRFDPVTLPVAVGVKELEDSECIIGHNIIGYDNPALDKLVGFKPKGRVLDTYVLCRLLWPNIRDTDFKRVQDKRLPGRLVGKHTLEAWGYRLGVYKGTFAKQTDWQTWTPEMSDYCEQDVVVTLRLWDAILNKTYSQEASDMEHAVAAILQGQERHGFLFNAIACQKLYAELLAERETLKASMQKEFPPFYKQVGKVFTPKQDNKRFGYVEGCPMSKIKLVEFNPGSSQHIYAMFIRKYKWQPAEFTKKSYVPEWLMHLFPGDEKKIREPKIDEDILNRLPYPEAKKLARYMMLDKRCGQMAEGKQAWLKVFSGKTQRIHGGVNTLGAVTGRMTHMYPNVAQTPASYSPYGKEMRGMFIVPKGYKLVGCDAAGLEARCLAHFLAPFDGGAYAEIILNGDKAKGTDVHSVNAKILGISRDDAKTFLYAFMYGAGNQKLGSIVGPTANPAQQVSIGKKYRAKFLKGMPALKKLLEAVKEKVEATGTLRGLDGRTLYSRSAHSALNLLLQSAGALIMKKALVICDAELQEAGFIKAGEGDNLRPGSYDYAWVANIHDEYQNEVKEELADTIGKIMEAAITKAGEHFKFRIRLDGEYMVGSSWAETH